MTLGEGNSLNCRAFEICGAGGFQLIENKPIVETCFEPGREVICFDTVDDITDALARVEREPDWWRSVKESGQKRALAEHTYQHRLTDILRFIV
jgi:spore maturation protein CgeB